MFLISTPTACRMAQVSRRGLLAFALALPVMARAQPAAEPAAPIEALYAGLNKLMHEGKSVPFAVRFHELVPVIDGTFDLRDILVRSVGTHWAGLADPMREKLFAAFRTFTVVTYVANFDHYDSEQFRILPEQRSVGVEKVVATRITQQSGSVVKIDYVMRQEAGGWRVVDVLLDGSISRVAVQRSDFRALLNRGGAPALMASLQQKIADLSGGAPLDS